MSSHPILSIRHLKKSFENKIILDDVSFDVFEGEFLSILGKSGSGKTTLLRLIAGFEKTDEGEIYLGGEVISSREKCLSPELRKIAIVFQDHALWPHMNVFENVAFPLRVQKASKKQIDHAVEKVLSALDMKSFKHAMPHELSGGESQRIALARALIQQPRMIIFDEPLASLDALLRFELQGMIKTLQQEQKFTSIYITHDQYEAMRLSHRIAVLEEGKITQCAEPVELFKRPETEKIAKLIGQSTCVPVEVLSQETGVFAKIGGHCFKVNAPHHFSNILCVKSENIVVGEHGLKACVQECSFMGEYYLLALDILDQEEIILYKKSQNAYKIGDIVSFSIQGGWVLPLSGI